MRLRPRVLSTILLGSSSNLVFYAQSTGTVYQGEFLLGKELELWFVDTVL